MADQESNAPKVEYATVEDIAKLKDWMRAEIELKARGLTEEERKEANP